MSFLDIDELALDKEWVSQPKLAHRFGKKLADVRLTLDEEKNSLEITKAELDKDIRNNPDSYEIVKVTETIVANTILMQEDYIVQQKAVMVAQHAVNVLGAAVTGVEHKKRALEALVKLHSMDYFGDPMTDSDGGESLEKVSKQGARRKGTRKKSTK